MICYIRKSAQLVVKVLSVPYRTHFYWVTDFMNLLQLKHAMSRLSLSQLRKIDEWLHELIRRAQEADRVEKHSSRKQTTAEQALDNKTYRLESVRCGKENCKCARGQLHGPYWYSYARQKEGVTSQYIGKRLPSKLAKKLPRRSGK